MVSNCSKINREKAVAKFISSENILLPSLITVSLPLVFVSNYVFSSERQVSTFLLFFRNIRASVTEIIIYAIDRQWHLCHLHCCYCYYSAFNYITLGWLRPFYGVTFSTRRRKRSIEILRTFSTPTNTNNV